MESCDKVLDLFKEMLELHIKTKTNDTLFHKEAKFFYETIFDAYHDVKEVMQDSKQDTPTEPKAARKRAYEILNEVKSILESMVNSNKDIGTDNVLRGAVDKIGFQCGNAMGLCGCNGKLDAEPKEVESTEEVEEEKEEEMEEEAEPTEETEDEYEEDLVGGSMKGQDSGYKYSSKEEDEANKDELKKKKKGDYSEYTVVSIMPE